MALKLNPKQEKFCQLYASDKEFFANGVQSYIEAYNPDESKVNWYKTAMSTSSRMLRSVKICDKINELLETSALNDEFIDKQLGFLMTQHEDYKTKLGAVKEANTLKQRIVKKIDVTSKGEKLENKVDINILEERQKLDFAKSGELKE